MLVFFLTWWNSLVLFPNTEKVSKKKKKTWHILFVYLQVIWPLTNIRVTWTGECVLSVNYWNVNSKSKRVHLLCSLHPRVRLTNKFGKLWSWREERHFQKYMQRSRGCCRERKGLSIASWRRKEEWRGWAGLCHTASRKKAQRKQKNMKKKIKKKGWGSSQFKRVKEEAWKLSLG